MIFLDNNNIPHHQASDIFYFNNDELDSLGMYITYNTVAYLKLNTILHGSYEYIKRSIIYDIRNI